jgi:hypothetical protein
LLPPLCPACSSPMDWGSVPDPATGGGRG